MSKIKLLMGIIMCSLILTGCQTNKEKIDREEQPEKYKVTIIFENDELTEQEDLILLADDEGNIYHGFRSTQKKVSTTVPTNDFYLIDEELDLKEKLPKIKRNEEYYIIINYETKEYSLEIKPKQDDSK